MNINKTKRLYLTCKTILDILESGDIKDDRYCLLIRTMTVEQVEKIQTFVASAKDMGINLIARSIN